LNLSQSRLACACAAAGDRQVTTSGSSLSLSNGSFGRHAAKPSASPSSMNRHMDACCANAAAATPAAAVAASLPAKRPNAAGGKAPCTLQWRWRAVAKWQLRHHALAP
jgi:hypothetical protein